MDDSRGKSRIEELLRLWQELHDQGHPITVEELAAGSAELASGLTRNIESIRSTQTGSSPAPPPDREHTSTYQPGGSGSAPAPDFDGGRTLTGRLVGAQFHARGGLGEVFVACQQELDRPVAVKRIRPDRLHATARMRFLREAAITARLQHPGIVPIHGLGEDEDGPFYTMPFIRGSTLLEAIRDLHADEDRRRDPGRRGLELRKFLQRFIAVCDTMAYAHDQGVVHRDLKPSNIMLGPYGETLVMDWGLAKRYQAGAIDPAAEETPPDPSPSPEDVTAAGAVVGTPRYMSPEQASGRPAGPASDLYSLGVILYTILTGKSPYREHPPADPLYPVREAIVVPPRAHDARIPRPLEAVCLRALAARPPDRYASARALGEDLSRWLADEPVLAHREGLSARVARWTRRHRASVQAAALALIVVAVLATTAAIVVDRARRGEEAALQRVTQALASEQAARAEAQQNLGLAARAVDDYFTKISENALLKRQDAADVRDLRPLRKELLEVALDYYNRLAVRGAADPALGAERAAAYSRVGRINDEIGSKRAALEAFRQAETIRAGLVARAPGDRSRRRELALCQIDVAAVLEEIGREADALRKYTRSQDILGPLAAADPGDRDLEGDLARAHNGAGMVLRALGRAEDALESFKRGRAAVQRLVEAGAASGEDRRRLATAHSNIALLLDEMGRNEEAEAALGQCRSILLRLLETDASNGGLKNDLAACDNNLGLVFSHAGRLDDALAALARGRPVLEELVKAHPSVTTFRRDLATNYINSGTAHSGRNRPAEALRDFERARSILEPMLESDPADTDNRRNLAATLYNIADALRATGKIAAAREPGEGACKLLESSAERAPFDEVILACAHDLCADLFDKEGRPTSDRDRAAKAGHLARALEALRRAVAGGYRVFDPGSFAAIRGEPEFRELMLDIAFPDWPFATGPPP